MSSYYTDTLPGRIKLQTALAEHGFQPGPADGVLGQQSARAIMNARIAYKLDKQDTANVDIDLERELGLLTIQDPAIVAIAKAKGIDIFTLLKLIGLANRLLKGDTTMTSDQIGGVIRAILTFLAGLAVAKGWVDNATALTVVGALVTLATAAWSVFTNRPANIASK